MEKQKLALIGADGMLGSMVRRVAPQKCEVLPFSQCDLDITDRTMVMETLREVRPEIILNCAAYTDVDKCESREELAAWINGAGPGFLAEAARVLDAALVHISTDYVFDGTGDRPYTEDDAPNPKTAYGRTKLLGEKRIQQSGLERYFILRTSWLYGPKGNNFVETISRFAKERKELRIVDDQRGSPTFTRDLAEAIFRLLEAGSRQASPGSSRNPYGLYHFANAGECTWFQFGKEIVCHLREAGEVLEVERITPVTTEEFPRPAPRPAYSVLSVDKYREATGAPVPDWRASLSDYFKLLGKT